jgi:Xaa-Pro dipeptidase
MRAAKDSSPTQPAKDSRRAPLALQATDRAEFAAFALEEYEERLRLVRTEMDRSGLEALVCIAPESLYYLSGYDANTAWSEQALVVTMDAHRLVIRDIDVPLAEETVVGTEVTAYQYGADDPAAMVATLTGRCARVGVETNTTALSPAYSGRLGQHLSHRLTDTPDLVARLRVRKSPKELEYIQAAAALAASAFSEAKSKLTPGITELEFAAEIEYALRRRGSEYPGMPTWLASGPRTASSHASPTRRMIGTDEPVKCSFAAVVRRYHVTTYQPFYLGEPPPLYRQYFGACLDALEVLVSHAAPGRPIKEACHAAHRTLDAHGLAGRNMGRWGYGVGIAYPPTWLEPLDVTTESEELFDVGMVLCLHVSLSAPDHGFGFTVGADYAVTESGARLVNADAPYIHIAS